MSVKLAFLPQRLCRRVCKDARARAGPRSAPLRMAWLESTSYTRPEEVKVVEGAGGDEDQQRAECEAAVQQNLSRFILDIPHGPATGRPVPKQKEKREAAQPTFWQSWSHHTHGALMW
jgi:hypothetical protein